MPNFHPNLTARRVHTQLRRSLAELQTAEKNAVLWFAEMLHRKLYKELGYGSIHQYAAVELEFSPSKTSQFLRLCEGLERLPHLKKAMVEGEIGWTKAREIEKVATAKTERTWIAQAKQTSRRALEEKVRVARQRAKVTRAANPEQMALAATSTSANAGASASSESASGEMASGEMAIVEVPSEIRITLDPKQLARYEALMETLRKQGHRAKRADLLLAGLEALAQEGAIDRASDLAPDLASDPAAGPASDSALGHAFESTDGSSEMARTDDPDFTRVKSRRLDQASGSARVKPRGRNSAKTRSRRGDSARPGSRSSYQVLVHYCPRCDQGTVHTTRGESQLSPASMAAVLCDADIREQGKRVRARVSPKLRREILSRDGHRCRSEGCRNTHFLEVHHRVKNGSNDPANLITLCDACHDAVHGLEHGRASAPPRRRRA